HPDLRHHRHAWADGHIIWKAVEHELHRHALHHLDVVARRVLSGQQTEGCTGAWLDAVDMALEGPAGIGVDRQLDVLARPHVRGSDWRGPGRGSMSSAARSAACPRLC